MNKFVRNLLTEWRRLGLPFEDETFVVAVSGGADSVSLMLALENLRKRKKLKLRFVIAHFNHDLRGNDSRLDAEFVKDLAEKFGFELALGKKKISRKGNLEQNARVARYDFLFEIAENLKAYGILTAHTINDQAETFLLNLIRGSGIEGLSAMKAVNANYERQIEGREKTSPIALVRPLLNWGRREDTLHFCADNNIAFRRDEMNEDLSFKRVRVRKILLPLLKDFNPKIIEILASTSKLLSGVRFDSISLETTEINFEKEYLELKELINLSKQTLYEILRKWLRQNRGSLRGIERKHIEAIERLIVSRKSGRTSELPNGETVIKHGGKIFWKQKNIDK